MAERIDVKVLVSARTTDYPEDNEDFVIPYHGRILFYTGKNNNAVADVGRGYKTVGAIEGRYIDLAAARWFLGTHGLFSVMDSDSAELGQLHDLLIDRHCSVKERLVELPVGNAFYINHLFVEPEFRGKNIGSAAVIAFLRVAARGCSAIAVLPSPIDLIKDGVPREDARFKAGLKRVRAFYERLGFRRMSRRSDFWYLGCAYLTSTFDGEPVEL